MGITFAVTIQTLAFLHNSFNKGLNFCASTVSPGEFFSLKHMWVIFVRHYI